MSDDDWRANQRKSNIDAGLAGIREALASGRATMGVNKEPEPAPAPSRQEARSRARFSVRKATLDFIIGCLANTLLGNIDSIVLGFDDLTIVQQERVLGAVETHKDSLVRQRARIKGFGIDDYVGDGGND